MKPKTVNKSEVNLLRAIIRKAMSDVKEREWSVSQLEARTATWTWEQLDNIFKKLGPFA